MPEDRITCTDCGGQCCRHPTLTTTEYIQFSETIGSDLCLTGDPKWLGDLWTFSNLCPARTETGCMFPYEDRPLACRIYPYVAIPGRDGKIYLLMEPGSRCPGIASFIDREAEAVSVITQNYHIL